MRRLGNDDILHHLNIFRDELIFAPPTLVIVFCTAQSIRKGREFSPLGSIMWVLSRKVVERLWIGENISITVVKISGGGVRIGVEAPAELPVVREELKARNEQEAKADGAAPKKRHP